MTARTVGRRAALLVAGLVLAGPARGQEVRTAVGGDTLRVGDVVPVAVRVTVERGQRVALPDTLPVGDAPLENAARVRERVDTLPDGRLQVTGVYGVTPWRTGELALPEVEVAIVTAEEGTRVVRAQLPALEVASVLPSDTAGIEPKPTKGVVGPSWAWWPFVLALLALLALLAALVWWWLRRRRQMPARVEPAVPPRQRVLSRLQEARAAGLVEAGAMKEFYTLVAEALREYLSALDGDWGEDLTTTEVLGRVRLAAGAAEAGRLAPVLRSADQVKFARRVPTAAEALEEWERARSWAADFDWPTVSPEEREAA